MKIGIFSISDIPPGKHNVRDHRLDELHKISKSGKKTYIQVELVQEDRIPEAEAIMALEDSRTDLILKDLEFIDNRLAKSEDEKERSLLNKLKGVLEKESFIFDAGLSEEEKQAIRGYGLLTNKPVAIVHAGDLEALDSLLLKVINDAGFISFFTSGEKESRAWLIRKGSTAWEASGEIHSDIQKGFIRAEVIGIADFIALGGESKAKQAGKMRLENKDYIIQDADVVTFRFNK